MSSIHPTKRSINDFFRLDKEPSLSEFSKEKNKTQAVAEEVFSDSEEEFSDSEDISPPTFSRSSRIRSKQMTINAKQWGKQFNIKGGELIQIGHDVVHSIHNRLDQSKISANTMDKNGVISIQDSLGWIKFLGGWRGNIANREFHFFTENDEPLIFSGAKIANTFFPIKNNRLYFPLDRTRTVDFSYPEIILMIERTKELFQKSDSDLALLQLASLSDVANPKALFFHFLNALMFGMEATGANTGIITSLMILELIAEGKLTYQDAFDANKDGGMYPYATFGNNKGTYASRSMIIEGPHNDMGFSYGMQWFRRDLNRSPVAIKEALLIKYWLKTKGIIQNNDEHYSQKETIRKSFEKLVMDHFAIKEEHFKKTENFFAKYFSQPPPKKPPLKTNP